MKKMIVLFALISAQGAYADNVDTCSSPYCDSNYVSTGQAASVSIQNGSYAFVCRDSEDQGGFFTLTEEIINGVKSYKKDNQEITAKVTIQHAQGGGYEISIGESIASCQSK